MALPSKPKQVEAIMKFLDSERQEERSLKEIATEIVDGYHDALTRDLKKPATPLRLGMLIKSPYDSKVRRVAWLSGGEVWVVHETSSYGWLGPASSPAWGVCEEFFPKTFKEIEGKRKSVEMTPEEIAEKWSNPEWSVGQKVSQHQREHVFEVIATGPACVLMMDTLRGVLVVDSNASLEKHYQREID